MARSWPGHCIQPVQQLLPSLPTLSVPNLPYRHLRAFHTTLQQQRVPIATMPGPKSDAYDDGYIRLNPIEIPKPSLLRGAFPPCSLESAKAAREVLQRNHVGFHVFFNESNFHNHLPHHVLAALQLGAPPSEFEAIWKHAQDTLDPEWKLNKKPSKDGKIEKINRENWTSHLGARNYYWCYLDFFDHEISEHGLGPCLDKFVFSPEANQNGRNMMARFVGGVVHPCIHTGYGAEFSVAGVAAEGEFAW